jgi:hypothetical protein
MHSFISSSESRDSESRAARHAMVVLLVAVLCYCGLLEFFSRVALNRISRTQHRISEDYRAAKSLRGAEPGDAPTMLVVGNSLLLVGVDRPLLAKRLASNYLVAVLPVENTQFEDWYFGLRRLYAEGSRPSTIVVCLSTQQMISNSTYGEYFAHYLMRTADLLVVKRAVGLDNTVTSNYFFAHWSAWLGSRAETRNWLIHKLMPNLGQLTQYFPAKPSSMPQPSDVVERALIHLRVLKDLSTSYGSTFVAVVPPTLDANDAQTEVQDAAARVGIAVLIPLRPKETSLADYNSDGFHLNPKGAVRFTERLSVALRNLGHTELPDQVTMSQRLNGRGFGSANDRNKVPDGKIENRGNAL